jgi:hypothetical protein
VARHAGRGRWCQLERFHMVLDAQRSIWYQMRSVSTWYDAELFHMVLDAERFHMVLDASPLPTRLSLQLQLTSRSEAGSKTRLIHQQRKDALTHGSCLRAFWA